MLAERLALLPLIAGISYEFLKLSAKYQTSLLARAVSKPGLWLQHLTTKEPDTQQIEVAIAALNEALTLERSFSTQAETAKNTVATQPVS